jgi:hypothetical protein
MGAAGQVAGKVGQADSHKYHIAVTQQAGGVDAHQFRGCVSQIGHKCSLISFKNIP